MKFARLVSRDENDTRTDTRARATPPARRRRRPAATPVAPFEPLERRALLAGQLDPSFGGGDGVASHPDAGVDVWPEALAAAPDGKLVAVGNDDSATASFDFVVARCNSDGTVDSSFGNRGRVTTDFAGNRDEVVDVLVQSDGKVVVAGHTGAPTGGGGGDLALARYNLDGSLDTTFDGDGVAPMLYQGGPAPTLTMGVGPDGKVTVAGLTPFNPNAPDAVRGIVVTRVNADGSPDTSFSGDGAEAYPDPDPTVNAYPDVITFASAAPPPSPPAPPATTARSSTSASSASATTAPSTRRSATTGAAASSCPTWSTSPAWLPCPTASCSWASPAASKAATTSRG